MGPASLYRREGGVEQSFRSTEIQTGRLKD